MSSRGGNHLFWWKKPNSQGMSDQYVVELSCSIGYPTWHCMKDIHHNPKRKFWEYISFAKRNTARVPLEGPIGYWLVPDGKQTRSNWKKMILDPTWQSGINNMRTDMQNIWRFVEVMRILTSCLPGLHTKDNKMNSYVKLKLQLIFMTCEIETYIWNPIYLRLLCGDMWSVQGCFKAWLALRIASQSFPWHLINIRYWNWCKIHLSKLPWCQLSWCWTTMVHGRTLMLTRIATSRNRIMSTARCCRGIYAGQPLKIEMFITIMKLTVPFSSQSYQWRQGWSNKDLINYNKF